MRFNLVVPALNEEGAIAGTLRRCLAARERVERLTPVEKMTVTFVNDGSTDRTQEIVGQPEFDGVVKVRFERNRGYGAAIKAGWQATNAELVGFIDGDGTCDPERCVDLVNRLVETQADVVLAGRMSAQSQMPLIRKAGNVLFARLLGVVSGRRLTDSASGFRIVRRASLPLISPLPDGLHFTPAMSCICLLDPRLRIEEVPLPYAERIGRSKLSVIRDGVRFLWTILFAACVYTPIKTMAMISVLATLVFAGAGWAAWLNGQPHAIWPIAFAGALTVTLLLGAGVVAHELNHILIGRRKPAGAMERWLECLVEFRRLILGGGAVFLLGLAGLTAAPALGQSQLPMLLAWVLVVTVGGLMMLGGVVVRVIFCVHLKHQALMRDEYAVKVTTPPAELAPDRLGPAMAGAAALQPGR